MNSAMKKILVSIVLLLSIVAAPAWAQLRVEISGSGAQQFPVAVVNFAGESQSKDLEEVIRADLTRSGLFKIVDSGSAALPETTALNFGEWKGKGVDAVVIGSVQKLANGSFDVRYRLFDTVKQAQLDALSFNPAANNMRLAAHQIADRIYEKITGDKGVFATRIAYVVRQSQTSYELQVADSDGYNPQPALRSREPIISPTWSFDGSRLAYVSFEDKKPVVFVHEVASGKRTRVASFRGSNSAPAFSPDGRTLAVTLSKDGLSQLYTMPSSGGNAQRLTNSTGIDTEAAYAADGQIYFVSDRSGGPQIYRMSGSGGDPTRVTFKGDYNISPSISPDGKTLAYVSRRGGKFQLFSLDLNTGNETALTDSVRDESPSFAPNGKVMMYATEKGGRGVLATVSVDGRIRQSITSVSGDIREPAWGPWIK
jgi:TolB protein